MFNYVNEITKYDPTAYVVALKNITNSSSSSLVDLGEEASKEITKHITEIESDYEIEKITLIGYSMGGLVIRSALPYLSSYAKYFENFISIATPNLGYLNINNSLLTSGIWLVDMFAGSKILSEISLKDSKKINNCYLYKLSDLDGLSWFKTGKL